MVEKIKKKHAEDQCGRLFIKELPASDTCAKDIGIYLEKLRTLKQFTPDLIVVDYLGLMRPNDKAMARSTYERGKYVSEELRGLAFEYNCPLVSAVQTGRQSYGQKNVGMEDTSDSIAIVQTADTYITLGKPKDFDENNQLFGKVVKSRGVKEGCEFILQLDYTKLKILDFDEASDSKEDDDAQEYAEIARELKSKNRNRKKVKTGDDATKTSYKGIE
jgi:replicative DNA helicase